MGERREGMNVGEEVVDEQLQDAQGRDALLSVQDDGAIGKTQRYEGMGGVVSGRRGHLRGMVVVVDFASLLGFSCGFGGPVRWSPSFLDALVRAGYVELATGSTWRRSTFTLGSGRNCQYQARVCAMGKDN